MLIEGMQVGSRPCAPVGFIWLHQLLNPCAALASPSPLLCVQVQVMCETLRVALGLQDLQVRSHVGASVGLTLTSKPCSCSS